MTPEFREIADSIRQLSLQEKAYLAKMLLADIKSKENIVATAIPEKRTFGEYIGKIRMSDDFNEPLPDNYHHIIKTLLFGYCLFRHNLRMLV